MKFLRGSRAIVTSLLAVIMLIGPVVGGTTAVAQDPGKILRIHQQTFPDVVDPQQSSFANEIAILSLNYEGLTRQDSSLQVVPGAAESWEFNDDLTVITFHLREGLTYSDGSPLTAERFRYAVERTCDPVTAGQYPSILYDVVGCEDFQNSMGEGAAPEAYDEAKAALGIKAIDDLTLEVSLNAPAPYFPSIASLWVFFPAKQELIEQGGDLWWKDPAMQIGNGPFQLSSWTDDQQVSLVANENYWAGRTNLDGIDYVYQADSAVAIEAFRSGDLDMVTVDPSQLPVVTNDPALNENLVSYAVSSTYTLNMNLTQEPWTDIKVREAFSLAFDRDTYCSVIRSGDCAPTYSWVPPGIPGSIETTQGTYDPEAAKQALADSSYGSAEALPPIKMYYNSNDSANTARAEWVAGQYRDVLGVEIELVPTEGTALVALRKEPETFPHLLLVGGWIGDYPDPQNWLSVYFTCNSTFAMRFGYCNPEFDALVKQADAEPDVALRTSLYEQASQILVDDIPGPFLYNGSANFLVSPDVSGYVPTALDVSWPGQFTSLMDLDVNRP